MASATQCVRWSSSSSSATACSALVAAEIWVEHVDAVRVLVDHALQPADLALDPAQPLLDGFLVVGVAGHVRGYTPWGMMRPGYRPTVAPARRSRVAGSRRRPRGPGRRNGTSTPPTSPPQRTGEHDQTGRDHDHPRADEQHLLRQHDLLRRGVVGVGIHDVARDGDEPDRPGRFRRHGEGSRMARRQQRLVDAVL